MILIKYDRTRDTSGKSLIVGGGSGNSNTSTPSRGDDISSLDRNIWGKHDNGDDIDGSMIVNGNVTIKSIIPPIYEPDDDGDDGEDEDYETGGGNLTVELGVTAKNVYGHSLYLDYPKANDTKTNVIDLFKDQDTRITNNKSEIDSLKDRVSTAENNIITINNNITTINNNITTIQGDVTNIKSDITTITSNVNNLSSEINDIKTRIEELESGDGLLTKEEVNEMITNAVTYPIFVPVILFTGTLQSENGVNGKTWQPFEVTNDSRFHPFINPITQFHVDYISKDENKNGLCIKFFANSGWFVTVTSVSAMVTRTSDYDVMTSVCSGNHRSKGYWCTGGVNDNSVYISAWRTQDDNNDSVRFDCMAGRVQELSVTVYGYAYKL